MDGAHRSPASSEAQAALTLGGQSGEERRDGALGQRQDAPLLAQSVGVLADTLPAIDRDLLAAFAGASAPNSLRALTSDFVAFEAWCRNRGVSALPAAAVTIADYLQTRDCVGRSAGVVGALQSVDLPRPRPCAIGRRDP